MNKMISRIATLNEVDSTNNYVAKALETGDYEEGTAIMSRFQTQGRGQRGSQWQSAPGENLTLSFALNVDFLPVFRSFLLSKAVSIGLRNAVASMAGVGAKVKWPNDILAGNSKIAGILIETKILGARYAVIGIGLNINQTAFDPELKATSLALELDRPVDVDRAATKVLNFLNPKLEMLRSGDFTQLNHEYTQVLHGYRSRVSFQTPERNFDGMITEVDEQGMLLVRSMQGHAAVYAPKEIKIAY